MKAIKRGSHGTCIFEHQVDVKDAEASGFRIFKQRKGARRLNLEPGMALSDIILVFDSLHDERIPKM